MIAASNAADEDLDFSLGNLRCYSAETTSEQSEGQASAHGAKEIKMAIIAFTLGASFLSPLMANDPYTPALREESTLLDKGVPPTKPHEGFLAQQNCKRRSAARYVRNDKQDLDHSYIHPSRHGRALTVSSRQSSRNHPKGGTEGVSENSFPRPFLSRTTPPLQRLPATTIQFMIT